jgi:hypothetical protein
MSSSSALRLKGSPFPCFFKIREKREKGKMKKGKNREKQGKI